MIGNDDEPAATAVEPDFCETGAGAHSVPGRLLAFLIRAAMKPWMWIVLVLLALILAPLVWIQSSIARIPDIGEPFDVAAMRAVTVPDKENAFTVYRQAAALYSDFRKVAGGDRKRSETMGNSQNESQERGWSAANYDLRQWLEINRHALEVWREGTARNDAVEVQPRDLQIDSLLDATQASREFVRLALLEADRLADASQPREAWQWLRGALRSGRHVGMHATIIGRLVGAASLQLSTKPILRWGARPDVSADMLRAALEDVQKLNAMTPPTSECLKIDYIAWPDRPEELVAIFRGIFGQSTSPTALIKLSGYWERTRRIQKLLVANWLTQCDLPRWERATFSGGEVDLFIPGPGVPADPKLIPPAQIAELFTDYRRDLRRFGFPDMINSTPHMLAVSFDREAAAQRALELALALELYHRERGEFPATLEPLLRGYLKQIPADPFGKGEPLRYRREPDGGATVWSIGQDGVDQHGKVERTNQNPSETQFDDVFHLAAPKK